MKTVIHHNKIYEIEDYQLEAIEKYEQLIELAPDFYRQALAYNMLCDCKRDVFSKTEYKKIDRVI